MASHTSMVVSTIFTIILLIHETSFSQKAQLQNQFLQKSVRICVPSYALFSEWERAQLYYSCTTAKEMY